LEQGRTKRPFDENWFDMRASADRLASLGAKCFAIEATHRAQG
jgi:hypothetical protein